MLFLFSAWSHYFAIQAVSPPPSPMGRNTKFYNRGNTRPHTPPSPGRRALNITATKRQLRYIAMRWDFLSNDHGMAGGYTHSQSAAAPAAVAKAATETAAAAQLERSRSSAAAAAAAVHNPEAISKPQSRSRPGPQTEPALVLVQCLK